MTPLDQLPLAFLPQSFFRYKTVGINSRTCSNTYSFPGQIGNPHLEHHMGQVIRIPIERLQQLQPLAVQLEERRPLGEHRRQHHILTWLAHYWELRWHCTLVYFWNGRNDEFWRILSGRDLIM